MMSRINVYHPARDDGGLAGWFNDTTARRFTDYLDPMDTPSHTAERFFHTTGGRWVRLVVSAWQGTVPEYSFVTSDEAREWLLRHDYDEAVTELFGPIEDESGPIV